MSVRDEKLQKEIAEKLGVKPTIDVAAEIGARVNFLADYLRTTRAAGYVLGISGGTGLHARRKARTTRRRESAC